MNVMIWTVIGLVVALFVAVLWAFWPAREQVYAPRTPKQDTPEPSPVYRACKARKQRRKAERLARRKNRR